MKIKQGRKYDDVLPGQWWEVDQNKVSYLQEKKGNQAKKQKRTEGLTQMHISELLGNFCTGEWSFVLADFS